MSFPKFLKVGDEVTNKLPSFEFHFDNEPIPFGAPGIIKEFLGQHRVANIGCDTFDFDWKFIVSFGNVDAVRYQDDLHWE